MTNNRITYRRRKSYNTKSNRIRAVKTPGGRLVAQYVSKNASGPKLSLKTRTRIAGVKTLRSHQYKKISKSQRSVKRLYSGVFSPKELKERITRSFLLEEVKLAKIKIQLEDQKAKQVKKNKNKKK